jgi:hypothetical protein
MKKAAIYMDGYLSHRESGMKKMAKKKTNKKVIK